MGISDSNFKNQGNMVNLLVATHNPSKLKRYQNELADLNLESLELESLDKIEQQDTNKNDKLTKFGDKFSKLNLISLADLDYKLEIPAEIGKNTLEIVKNKAQFYFDQTQIPCFSSDSGLYFPSVPDKLQPKQNVKGIAGANDQMTSDEIYDKMISFYSNLATDFGQKNGEIWELEGYFLDSFALFDGKNYFKIENQRPITLTSQIWQKDINFPICSLYKIKCKSSENKYYHDLNAQEMKDFLQESSNSLKKIIQNWLKTL